MIHRAIFGSLEWFFGILIEHFGGSFPLWLAPEQYTVIPISEDHFEECKIIDKNLSLVGLRGKVDLSSDRFNNKIRKAQKMKIPLMIIIGNNEVENSSLTKGKFQMPTAKINPFTERKCKETYYIIP